MTVRELAAWVEGEVAGDGEKVIDHARPLADAQPGDITFVESDRHLPAWHDSRASAAVVRPSVPVNGRPLIYVKDPLMAFASILKRLRGGCQKSQASIHPTACIHPSARLDADVAVGPFVVVGEGSVIGPRAVLHAGVVIGENCRLGADVTLHSHVVLYADCILGNRITIHANSVIGSDGFGYRPQNGVHVKVPQLGHVEICDNVEIGACTTIDRGTFGATRIGEGTKIDNLVQIAHNCQIGRRNLLVSQVGIAGSVVTGEYVVMAGQSGVADHHTIGDRVQVGAQSGVIDDIPSDMRIWGMPARNDKDAIRAVLCLDKLPKMLKDLKRMKEILNVKDAA